MMRAVLLALSVICAIYGSHAFDIEKLAQAPESSGWTLASTRIIWQGDSCSGNVARISPGPVAGCYNGVGNRMSVSCNNSTGRTTFFYSGYQCAGDWYMASAASVSTCWLSSEGPNAQFCGSVTNPIDLSSKPVPKPIPGAGKLVDRQFQCDYRAGECPTNNMTVILWYSGKDCTGTVDANVPFLGLTMGKCYLVLTPAGRPDYNIETILKDGIIYFVQYQSGCHGGKNSIFTQFYPANRCINIRDQGSMMALVPLPSK